MGSSQANSNRPKVKICGIRNASEALTLDALGVDWIGFNFHPASSRYIHPEAAAPLVKSLRQAKSVGVFVDLDPKEVLAIIAQTGIQAVQLHGQEDLDYILKMPVPVIKAIPHTRLKDLGGLRDSLLAYSGKSNPLVYFLIDTQITKPSSPTTESIFGGSGQAFDWKILTQASLPLPYFLAGGLGPENLEQALKSCSPFAVDLNSKVEFSPGRKDIDKVKDCLKIINEAGLHPPL